MKRILIITHSAMAKGIKDTVEFLAGEQNIDCACCFTEISNPDQYIDEYIATVGVDDKLIVFTDIKGGSVNQKMALRLKDDNFYLITGINLPLVLELSVASEEAINKDYINRVIDNARNEIVLMNDALKNNENIEDDFF